jgi:hypothetical protein
MQHTYTGYHDIGFVHILKIQMVTGIVAVCVLNVRKTSFV